MPCPSDLNYEINSDIDTGTTDQTNHHIVFKNCTNSQFTEPNMFIKLEQSHDKIPTRSQKRFVESSRSMIENLNNPKIQGATTLFHVMIKPAHLSR